MKTVGIKQKLEEMGVALDSIQMGDFDYIGEYTAKRDRKPGDPNYKSAGAFYRSNYERGILIYYLIRQHNLSTMLEVGFGRGYATFCAARAFHDAGIVGKVVTIEPALDEKFVGALRGVFPADWFKYVHFAKGTSQQVLPTIQERFDLVYIDGDHSYQGTKFDWEQTKDKYNRFLLFDDYHLPTKDDPGIKCSQLIDEVEDPSKELIIMDRRMFFDDRRFTDDQVDYGQVLLSKPGEARDDW
jgi:predicted O-methyltransferase YrrM